ncbi:hypothetical protein C8J57DRAFT_1261380 [Mycena rebaudengoi]|nr:hypothetical protein C8J57DRAFT_1261380 [Mycena rebaudengoi]
MPAGNRRQESRHKGYFVEENGRMEKLVMWYVLGPNSAPKSKTSIVFDFAGTPPELFLRSFVSIEYDLDMITARRTIDLQHLGGRNYWPAFFFLPICNLSLIPPNSQQCLPPTADFAAALVTNYFLLMAALLAGIIQLCCRMLQLIAVLLRAFSRDKTIGVAYSACLNWQLLGRRATERANYRTGRKTRIIIRRRKIARNLGETGGGSLGETRTSAAPIPVWVELRVEAPEIRK